jgi:hypothetical protein
MGNRTWGRNIQASWEFETSGTGLNQIPYWITMRQVH